MFPHNIYFKDHTILTRETLDVVEHRLLLAQAVIPRWEEQNS